MAHNIENVEIFKTGTWRPSTGGQTTFTGTDLDDMVASFEALNTQPGFVPALKLGHSAMQRFFGNKQGAPRLGSVAKIWRVGDKILANFRDVPDELVDLIEKDRYNQVSVEVFPKYEFEGKTFKNLLTAVALLGAELPAVKGLKDLASALFEEDDFDEDQTRIVYSEERDEMEKFTQEQVDALIDAALTKATKEFEDSVDAKLADLTTRLAAQDEEIKTLRDDKAESEKTAAEFAETERKSKLKGIFDQGVKDGKLLPKQEESIMAMAASMSFAEGDKTEVQLFEDFVKDLPKQVDFKEHMEGDGDDKNGGTSGEQVDALTRKKMAGNEKMDYSTARGIILSEDTELANRYATNPME